MKIHRHAERIITQTGYNAGLSTSEHETMLDLVRRIDALAPRYQRASELACSGVDRWNWETVDQWANRQKRAVAEADAALDEMDQTIDRYGAKLQSLAGIRVSTQRDPRGAPIEFTRGEGHAERSAVSVGNYRAEIQARWEREELARIWNARRCKSLDTHIAIDTRKEG